MTVTVHDHRAVVGLFPPSLLPCLRVRERRKCVLAARVRHGPPSLTWMAVVTRRTGLPSMVARWL